VKIIYILILCCFQNVGYSQVPQSLNYQAVARRQDGSILANQAVGIRFSLLEGNTTGSVIYEETHQSTTNNFGLFTLAIGTGRTLSGSFSSINWGTGSKFLKVEIALQGGMNYQLQGVTQLLSVPYALYAEKSGSGQPGPSGPTGPMGAQGPVGPAGVQGTAGATGANGAKGDVGPQGTTGPQGAKGIDGKTILNGATNPDASIGVDGDFFINTTASQIFGPKTSGAWGAGINLAGLQGLPGLKSLIDLENFASSVACPLGGVIVKSGVDQNNNNVLDASEVDNTKQVCFTQGAILDKVVIIPFPDEINDYFSTTPESVKIIDKFNKSDYPGVDSIVFACHPRLVGGGTVTLQLRNLSDNTVIANSAITSSFSRPTLTPPLAETGNLFGSFPTHTISVGLTISFSNITSSGTPGRCFLYLYRK
jgi:hypothetical protein